jgi:hypothetical protein
MSDKTASQVQQINPFAPFFGALVTEQIARVDAANEEITKLQGKTIAQLQAATAEALKLWTGSFEYGVQLSNDFRKLAVDSAKQSLELVTAATRS